MNIENGMIVGADRHDPQSWRQERRICVRCGEDIPAEEIIKLGDDHVCRDCLRDYLLDNGADFVEDFIHENEKEYYMDWWWGGLDDDERLRMVRYVYEFYYLPECMRDKRADDRAEFCRDDDRFPEYVKGQLS